MRAGRRTTKRLLRRPRSCGAGTGAPGSFPPEGSQGNPVEPGFATPTGCDPLDGAVCLQPWPNDYFTTEDASTPTGRRLLLRASAMPRNAAGKPIEPSDYNRNDGFGPGSPIHTKIPGLDDQAAFDRTGLVPETDMQRSYEEAQPAVVIDADTGQRQLIWAELDANPASDADRNLYIRPGKNFEEGHRYIVALRRLKNRDGATIEPARAFKVYRDRIFTTSNMMQS